MTVCPVAAAGAPGTKSATPSMGRTGRAESKASRASSAVAITRKGRSSRRLCAVRRRISGGATTKKGGRFSALRAAQALSVISGPIPPGSPRVTASGRLAVVDDGVTTQVTEITPRHQRQALLGQAFGNAVEGGLGDLRLRLVADDEDAEAHGRVDGRARLADGQILHHLLDAGGKVADAHGGKAGGIVG